MRYVLVFDLRADGAISMTLKSLGHDVRDVLLAFAILCSAVPAGAAEPGSNVYVVMSLIGDDMSIVSFRPAVGSRFDQNVVLHIAVKDDHFDRLVLQTADAAIRGAATSATTQLLLTSDPATFALAEIPLASETAVKALLDPIAAQVRSGDPRYLVIVTKYRGDARLALSDGKVGAGKLSGLGFYVDNQMRTLNLESGASGEGFVAPFAYLTISLIDLKTNTVIRSESAMESAVKAAASAGTNGDPWLALTPAEKIALLDRLVRRAIADIVPRVIGIM
jgi:hypothetical protein